MSTVTRAPVQPGPDEEFRITISAMKSGQLFVDFPPDRYEGEKLAEKLIQIALPIIERQRARKTLVHYAGSDLDVRQHLQGKQK